MLFYDKLYYHVDGIETVHQDAFFVSKNLGKKRRETTKGWYLFNSVEILIHNWETIKYMKSNATRLRLMNIIINSKSLGYLPFMVGTTRNKEE